MIRIFTEKTELEQLKPDWQRLECAAAVSPFSTYAWASIWLKHFGEKRSLRVLAVINNGRVAGVAPLMLGRNPLFRQLELIGSGRLADYSDFLIDPKADRLAVIGEVVTALSGLGGWQAILLKEIPAESANLKVLSELLNGQQGLTPGFNNASVCPYLDTIGTDWGAYLQNLSNGLRSDLKKQWNRLSKRKEYQIRLINKPDDGLIQAIVNLHTGRKASSALTNTKTRDFFIDMTRALVHEDRLRLFVLEANHRPVAFIYNFFMNNRLYGWLTGFYQEYNHLSPGKVLLAESIKFCFDNKLAEFDFMRGSEAYKAHWTTSRRSTVAMQILRNTLDSRLRAYVDSRVRPVIKKVFA